MYWQSGRIAKMTVRFQTPVVPGDLLFENMPSEVREFLALGYSYLATLPATALEVIASRVNRWLDPTYPEPDVAALAADIDVGVDVMSAVRAAVTFQAAATLARARPISLDTFVAKARSAGALAEEHVAAVEEFGNQCLKPHDTAIGDALTRANSSTHIAPSFHSFDATIDLRVAAVDEPRVVTMPVAVASLQTDVPDRNLLFQMTARDVDQLLQELERVKARLTSCRDMRTQSVQEGQ